MLIPPFAQHPLTKGRYTPPHRREEQSWVKNHVNGKQHVHDVYAFTNPSTQLGMYENPCEKGNNMTELSVNLSFIIGGTPNQYYPPRFQHAMDFETVREVVQELYGLGLGPVG